MVSKSKRGGRHVNPGGRPPKPLDERALWGGKIRIGISPAHALKLQQLMLRQIDGVATPSAMLEYLIDRAVDG